MTWGFQPVQSMIAIGSGGSGGVGFAQGRQKLFYLPAPHTDFIFAVIGEELGLIGAVTLVLLFALLAWRGFRAARFAPDLFGQLLAGRVAEIAAPRCTTGGETPPRRRNCSETPFVGKSEKVTFRLKNPCPTIIVVSPTASN